MEKAKAFVGGGEWEEFVEGGFKLLVPGRSRDFKAARVSGIHEVTVRNVRSTRGSEGERFATSIVVYLDDSFRDANGRYREYVLIANWIALVESWVKSVPVSDQSKAAAVRYMEDKLSAAFAAPVGDYGTLALPSGVSFNFMTGGKASVGQPVKWLHIETYLRLSDGSTGADEAATKPAIAPALTPAHYP